MPHFDEALGQDVLHEAAREPATSRSRSDRTVPTEKSESLWLEESYAHLTSIARSRISAQIEARRRSTRASAHHPERERRAPSLVIVAVSSDPTLPRIEHVQITLEATRDKEAAS